MRPATRPGALFLETMIARRTLALSAAALVLAVAAGFALLAWQDARAPYLSEKEVDRKAYPTRLIDLDFPQAPAGVNYYGTLRMDVFIGRDGRVNRVDLIEATVPEDYKAMALAAFREARFEPALKDERKVKTRKRVEIKFEAPIRDVEGATRTER